MTCGISSGSSPYLRCHRPMMSPPVSVTASIYTRECSRPARSGITVQSISIPRSIIFSTAHSTAPEDPPRTADSSDISIIFPVLFIVDTLPVFYCSVIPAGRFHSTTLSMLYLISAYHDLLSLKQDHLICLFILAQLPGSRSLTAVIGTLPYKLNMPAPPGNALSK